MYPTPQVGQQQYQQNFYHRQSTSLLFRAFETRKPSPASQLIVTLPQQRRSQQLTYGITTSPLKSNNTPMGTHKHTFQSEFIHKAQSSEAIKIVQIPNEQQPQLDHAESRRQFDKFCLDKLSQTKTTTQESYLSNNEEDKQLTRRSQKHHIEMQKQLIDKDLMILQLQRDNKLLVEENKRLSWAKNQLELLRQENEQLRQSRNNEQIEQSPIRQSRNSEFISALSDLDKQKIESLVLLDSFKI